jgi:hypothetical protein
MEGLHAALIHTDTAFFANRMQATTRWVTWGDGLLSGLRVVEVPGDSFMARLVVADERRGYERRSQPAAMPLYRVSASEKWTPNNACKYGGNVEPAGRIPRTPTGRFPMPLVTWGAPGSDDDADKVPGEVLAHAKEAFGRRSEGQVAVLVFDSVMDGGDPAENYWLRFEHPLVRIELQISAGPYGSRLQGRLEPSIAIQVQLELDAGSAPRCVAVRHARFLFERLNHGVVRLSLLGTRTPPILHTDWFWI